MTTTSRVPGVMVVFGTRPEVIKLAPVVRALRARAGEVRTVVVGTGQHAHLMGRFAEELEIPVDHDLGAGRPGQTLVGLHARIMPALDEVMACEGVSFAIVQGDTASALAGAQVAFANRVAVGHVEAGLRTDDPMSPFPEEMNRRLIGRIASAHFAATERNAAALRRELVAESAIHVTGNTVVDAARWIIERREPGEALARVFEACAGRRVVTLTTHRRESFGETMAGRMRALRAFVEARADVELIFPVHPNPATREAAADCLGGHERIRLIDPLGYADFMHLLKRSWMIVTDSGGVQEEAPTVGRPTIVIRPNTERAEAVECGVARLVPGGGDELMAALERAETDGWAERVAACENPFGDGRAGERIADIVVGLVRGGDASAGDAGSV